MCQMVQLEDGKYVAEIKLNHILNISKQAEACKNITKIMLFGSSLEERCQDSSDIDIAVFGKQTKGKYLLSKEYRDFRKRIFQFDMDQDYDILYFEDGKKQAAQIMENIDNGIELYRRA